MELLAEQKKEALGWPHDSPVRSSLPPCSELSRTSPAGGRYAAVLDSSCARRLVLNAAGTEEWLRWGPNIRMGVKEEKARLPTEIAELDAHYSRPAPRRAIDRRHDRRQSGSTAHDETATAPDCCCAQCWFNCRSATLAPTCLGRPSDVGYLGAGADEVVLRDANIARQGRIAASLARAATDLTPTGKRQIPIVLAARSRPTPRGFLP